MSESKFYGYGLNPTSGGAEHQFSTSTSAESVGATYIDFNSTDVATSGITPEIGRVHWNDDDQALNIHTGGSTKPTLQVGQEQWLRVRNNTGATLPNGCVVYVNGAQGNRPTVTSADVAGEALSSQTIGILTEEIANNGNGFCTTFGLVRGVDTAGLVEGDPIYLSTSGTFTTTRPTSPNHEVRLGNIIFADATDGIIFTSVNNGWELYELHDVDNNVDNARVLDGYYIKSDSGSGLWTSGNFNDDVASTPTMTDVIATSGNWDSTYTTVNTNSGNWDNVYTSVNTNSGNWQNTYTTVNTNSATNWDNSNNTLQTVSDNGSETDNSISVAGLFLNDTGGNAQGSFTATGSSVNLSHVSGAGSLVLEAAANILRGGSASLELGTQSDYINKMYLGTTDNGTNYSNKDMLVVDATTRRVEKATLSADNWNTAYTNAITASSNLDGAFIAKNTNGTYTIFDNVSGPRFFYDASTGFIIEGQSLNLSGSANLNLRDSRVLNVYDSTGVLVGTVSEDPVTSAMQLESNNGKDVLIDASGDLNLNAGGNVNLTSPMDSTSVKISAAAPTLSNEVATKNYVDSFVGGSDTQVQFNDGGVLAGDAGLTFDKTTNDLTVGGQATIGSILNVDGTKIILDTSTSASSRGLDLRTAGVQDWLLFQGGSSNDLRLVRYDLGGVFQGNVFIVDRSTGKTTYSNDFEITGNLDVGEVLKLTSTTNASPVAGDIWYDGSGVAILGTVKLQSSTLSATNFIDLEDSTGWGVRVDGTNDSFRPLVDNDTELGLSIRRWSKVWSTDGDFSGSVNIANVLNLTSASNPSPAEGDLWYDGTNLKFRDSTTTRTISWT
jgi:hypothetical protein